MPEAELARVDECDRSIPRRETIRGTHWQKTPFGCLDLASRNPSWQRSCATATTDRTYDRKRSDSHEQTLATRGPSTYGSRVAAEPGIGRAFARPVGLPGTTGMELLAQVFPHRRPCEPGCVKSPSFNLRVEHLSQIHAYGKPIPLVTSARRWQLRKQFC